MITMEIKASAIELVWKEVAEDQWETDFGDWLLTIYECDDKSFLFHVSDTFNDEEEKKDIASLEEAKSYAQQWANSLVASIAKPFVVPEPYKNLNDNERGHGFNNCRKETLKLNGVK
jgi:hypothetical protein